MRKRTQGETEGLSLLAACEASQGDRASMLVYADWLDENGREDEGYAWRWAATRNKWPELCEGLWCWNTDDWRDTPKWSVVPIALYNALELGRMTRPRKGLTASFSLLGEALKVLREACELGR